MFDLFVVDPQRDFCNPDGALFVPGAQEDIERLVNLIDRVGDQIENLIVSLDSHSRSHVACHLNWSYRDDDSVVAPFTRIVSRPTGYYVTTRKPEWSEREVRFHSYRTPNFEELTVWPPHCEVGTTGHRLEQRLESAIDRWEQRTGRRAYLIQKGQDDTREEFGAARNLSAATVLSTIRNPLYVAGEALTHCVITTLKEIHEDFPQIDLFLLEDLTSPVTGFEQNPDYLKARKGLTRLKTLVSTDL